ncbi:MAG TPA: CDP-alcohol phosphatidyltransferase family protein [Tepidisphaeraceae bacterium]|nr:CDP-alcohol phosphatidyltransferase family protein [Tepidisphaeraceae bacterium]
MAPDDAYNPADRRPIAARERRWSQALARQLVAWNASPNGISVAGMVSGILGGVALGATSRVSPDGTAEQMLWVAGAVLVQLRLLANMMDGMVAVASGKASRVGELYNEAPDRVSDAATLIGFGYATGGSPVLGYVAACLALFTAYVRTLGKAAGAPNDFCGPMAKQQRMFLVTLAAVYAALTPRAWEPAWGTRASWGLAAAVLAVIGVGCVITSARRLVRISRALRGGATA